VLTVSLPVPRDTVPLPVDGRIRVPNARALDCDMVTGWTIVVVPLVVTELFDCANAGEAIVETAKAAAMPSFVELGIL
jgi:hypothetical protein